MLFDKCSVRRMNGYGLIMRNPLSFFMTNVGDSFCNSYIYHLVGLYISDIGKEISSLVTC